jgi:hypothetical protein
VGNLSIFGGNISATSFQDGAGIGSAAVYSDGISNVGNLSIFGGNISANSVWDGAGIGSGFASEDDARHGSLVENLTILGGNIRATGSNSIAIGSRGGASAVLRITILNGSFHLNSAEAGIGPGSEIPVDAVTIWNGFFDCSEVISSFCFEARTVVFAGGSVVAITGYRRVGPSSPPNIAFSPEFHFEYLTISSRESFVGVPLLHLESISLPHPGVYKLTARQMTGSDPGLRSQVERTVLFNSSRSRGCAFSVPALGTYRISFESDVPSSSGYLHHNLDVSFSVDSLSDNLYYDVGYGMPLTWSLAPEESVPWKPVRIVLFVFAGVAAMFLIISSSVTLYRLMREFGDEANVDRELDFDFEVD